MNGFATRLTVGLILAVLMGFVGGLAHGAFIQVTDHVWIEVDEKENDHGNLQCTLDWKLELMDEVKIAQKWIKSQSCMTDFPRERKPYCGDGIIQFNEECDDGNKNGGDGCTPMCRQEMLIGPDTYIVAPEIIQETGSSSFQAEIDMFLKSLSQ